MGRVRLQDVAEVAGVSMKTVSNVVHNYAHVSQPMRERVQQAIDELGYRPNALGRSLATGKTGMLALAFSDVSLPYFSELARIVSMEASRRGYRLLLEQTDGTLEGERAVIAMTEAGLVDGIIFQPSTMSALEIARHRADTPLVLLGEGSAPLSVDRVMIDNVEAAMAATRHLLAMGRRRIGFLGHEQDKLSATSQQRLMGYQEALEVAGMRVDTALLIPSRSISSRDAARATGEALDRGLQLDSLFCRDDLAAIGALRALQERGLAVPGDVAVIGWDNISMSAFTYPSLTTVAADTSALASAALDLLEERIAGYAGAGRHKLVDYSLELRESAPQLP
jgi:DNA-binding LacI/PurR family transcriptional regulator